MTELKLESAFKRTLIGINTNLKNQNQNKYFNVLIDPTFQGVCRLFDL